MRMAEVRCISGETCDFLCGQRFWCPDQLISLRDTRIESNPYWFGTILCWPHALFMITHFTAKRNCFWGNRSNKGWWQRFIVAVVKIMPCKLFLLI